MPIRMTDDPAESDESGGGFGGGPSSGGGGGGGGGLFGLAPVDISHLSADRKVCSWSLSWHWRVFPARARRRL